MVKHDCREILSLSFVRGEANWFHLNRNGYGERFPYFRKLLLRRVYRGIGIRRGARRAAGEPEIAVNHNVYCKFANLFSRFVISLIRIWIYLQELSLLSRPTAIYFVFYSTSILL